MVKLVIQFVVLSYFYAYKSILDLGFIFSVNKKRGEREFFKYKYFSDSIKMKRQLLRQAQNLFKSVK